MKVRWGGPPTYILSRVPRKLSSWLKQMNTTASFPPSRVFQQVALVFSYVSAFHLHLARRLTFRSNRRLERRMIGWFQCTILQIILLFAEVPLRSTFQRSRGIIVKRLSPFFLERLCSPSGSHLIVHSRSLTTLVALATHRCTPTVVPLNDSLHCVAFRSLSLSRCTRSVHCRCAHCHSLH